MSNIDWGDKIPRKTQTLKELAEAIEKIKEANPDEWEDLVVVGQSIWWDAGRYLAEPIRLVVVHVSPYPERRNSGCALFMGVREKVEGNRTLQHQLYEFPKHPEVEVERE